jgi:hypothetical protein
MSSAPTDSVLARLVRLEHLLHELPTSSLRIIAADMAACIASTKPEHPTLLAMRRGLQQSIDFEIGERERFGARS